VVLDYQSPTPLTSANFAWHLIFGISSAAVISVMVDGRFIIQNKRSALDEDRIFEEARRASEKLWDRMREL
jgi:cytosine/adenosine deaminase-related metal-dependent hydrolase